MILVYTDQITSRIKYALDVVLKDVLGVQYSITDDKEVFSASDRPRFSYGKDAIDGQLHFDASRLLHEKGISKQNLSMVRHEGLQGFFAVGASSAIPFDPFASAFYLVTRYEEYLPSIRDRYGRFKADDSLAYEHGFLQTPVVNQYALHLKALLENRFAGFAIPSKNYTYIPSYDVDSAYAYLHKGLVRNIGGYLKSVGRLDFSEMADRTKVLLRVKPDPFDTFEYQHSLHKQYGLKAIYFFLLGDYDEYDKNISFDISAFQRLIKSTSDHSHVGIHPSFSSNENLAILKKEVLRLSDILNKEVDKSRQHFLKLDIPTTYQNLLEMGIQEDYTMGFAAQPGFRAGICSPYYFYNLDMGVKTNLKIFPFAIMDATMQYYLNLPIEQAVEVCVNVIDEVKKVNGTFISLWHNNSLSETGEWTGWRQVFEEMLKNAVPG